MIRFPWRLGAAAPAPVDPANRRLRRPAQHQPPDAACGWYESSRELQQGLAVEELGQDLQWAVELLRGGWLAQQLGALRMQGTPGPQA